MAELPSISIIVPTLNGGNTLARALQSLLDQDYPALEIVVVDGGSTDNSLEVISRFESRLSWWVSEPDTGQANAINKGFGHCSGDIVNWLCSDDELVSGALNWVGRFFAENPEKDMLIGACEMVFDDNSKKDFVFIPRADFLELLPAHNSVMQPSCFWRRHLMYRVPPLDESFNYALDMELWCYLKRRGVRAQRTSELLSRYVWSGMNKTASSGGKVGEEIDRVYRMYSNDLVSLSFWYRNFRYPFEKLLRRDRGLIRLGVLRIIQIVYMLLLMPFYGFKRVFHMSWPV